MDIRERIEQLRETVAKIDRKYAGEKPAPRPPAARVEDVLPGSVVATAYGEHFETERIWERHRRHGCVDISGLAELSGDLLHSLSAGEIQGCPPERWAFL